MAFMMKKKKYRFNVEIKLQDLENVALVNEVLFAKIRLLDGGSFQEYSSREEVRNHRVEWNRNFEFPCKMSANASTGVLDPCYLRISIRKEMKGGRSYYKLGFIDLNLAEYAGAGLTSRRFLLEGYDSRHRLDNSMLTLSIKMLMLSGDILFKAPTPNLKNKQKSPTDDMATAATGVGLQSPTSLTSSSLPSIGVTTRPVSTIRDDDSDPQYVIVTDSGHSESSESAITLTSDALVLQQQQQQQHQHQHQQQHQQQQTHLPSSYPPSSAATLVPGVSLTNAQQMLPYGGIGGTGGSGGGGGSSGVGGGSATISSGTVGVASMGIIGSSNCGTTASISGLTTSGATVPGLEMGHSRNSSNTSQMSKGSGYSSFSHSQHSRQSSEGDSGHARLNQRAINVMKLHIPALIHHHNPPPIDNKQQALQHHKEATTSMLCITNVVNIDENDELMFQTPNSSVREDTVVEDFRTPLNEMPSPPPLSSSSMYNMNMKYLNTPSPTYRSVNSNNSRSCSRESELSDGGGGERDSESETADDSGLDENFHTPRVAKIKSMENLSILEMEFHKASQELDRNSPRRLKWLAERERIQMPKMKSLNNLCFDDYSEEQMRAEFQMIREQNLEEKHRFNLQQRKNSTSSSNSGKLYIKNTKVGNAKFIGNDDSPLPMCNNNQISSSLMHYPIQKMRSMGTIPDVVTERIEPDPFLTPTSARKPQFPQLVTQSAEKPTPPSLNSYAAHRLLNYDCVDGGGGGSGGAQMDHHSYNSLNELYSQDRLGKLNLANDVSFMSRTPFERAYRRSLMKSSTPLRQSLGLIQQQQQFSSSTEENTITTRSSCARPHSNNAAYDIMSSRNFSGVPRRLLDGSNRQISSIALNASSTMSSASNNVLMNSSSSPYGTLSSIKSTHSSSSSSNGSHSSSSGSNNLITFQCTSVDTVDGLLPANTASASSYSSFTGNATSPAAAAVAQHQQHQHMQQHQQQHQHQQQSLVSSPASGGGGCSSVGVISATAATAAAGVAAVGGSSDGIVVLNSNSGGNSPRLGDAALSSLAASPTDACGMRSNPSAASLMANDMQGGSIASGICGAIGNTATLSPLSSAAAHHLMRRPSINMNPSSGSLVISETGSLDRMKNTAEKRKKGPLDDGPRVSDRVEETRVNPDSLIAEILKDTKLDQLEGSAETSGLQLYIGKDGTTSFGNHELKSRVSAGAFKQVVMENPR